MKDTIPHNIHGKVDSCCWTKCTFFFEVLMKITLFMNETEVRFKA